MTTWIDSSFAVEWLLGTDRAGGHDLTADAAILPSQFAETCAFFLKRDRRFSPEVLDSLAIELPDADELFAAAGLWLEARRRRSKASLADAILAAVARSRGDVVLSFDEDLRHLGMKPDGEGRWTRAS